MKLEEMISLNCTKSSNGGIIKKMLHAPTMTLYAVKEMPLESKASRDSLKYIMDNWLSKFAETSRLVNIYSCAYNHPEGCASIIMEFMNGGSLHSLLDTAMMLTEKVTKKIVWSVLHAIDAIHSNDLYHGGIKDSQILLTRDGKIKLNIG
jgi:serine/threonine protein kinase